ncbi:hypothetical protein [Paraburkholderia youngii]|uniref:hypothetical protein n=1 Tax=Paraburkholderia youngii TaxID=2782701 RepID=UPI003D23E42F
MKQAIASASSPDTAMSLANALGLRPLDRVQVANAREIAEMRTCQRMYGHGELPFFYFQRVIDGERFELRNPGGQDVVVGPLDICDIRHGTPLIVKAMPQPVFVERLKHPPAARWPITPEAYADAYVLFAAKGTGGSLQAHVWFVDPALNVTGRPWAAPLSDADRRVFESSARRSVMPVVESRRSGPYSADCGCAQEEKRNLLTVEAFFASALAGDSAGVAKASSCGLKPPRKTRSAQRALSTTY